MPAPVEFDNLIRTQIGIVQQQSSSIDAALRSLLLGVLMAHEIEAGLHQLGDTAIGIAHRLMQLRHHRRGVDMLRSGQTYVGEFAL